MNDDCIKTRWLQDSPVVEEDSFPSLDTCCFAATHSNEPTTHANAKKKELSLHPGGIVRCNMQKIF